MKNVTKVIAVLLCMALLFTAICGCNKDSEKTSSNASSSNVTSSEDTQSSEDNMSSDNEDDFGDFSDDFGDFSDDLDFDFDSFVDTRTLTFDNTQITNKYFGGISAVYSGFNFHSDSYWEPYTDEELDWEIDKILKTGVSLVRVLFPASWAWDYENNCYDYDSEDMKAFYKYAKILKDNDIKIAVNINDYLYDSIDGRKTPFVIIAGGNSDVDKCAAELGKFAADFINEVKIKRGFDNIEIIEMFTEPGSAVFDQGDGASRELFETNLKAYKAIHETLVERGLRDKIKIMGPNVSIHHLVEPYMTYYLNWLKWSVAEADKYIDIYSMHTYSRVTFTDDDYGFWTEFVETVSKLIKPTGKRLFIDEFGYSPSDNTSIGYDGSKYEALTGIHLASAYIAFMNSGIVEGATLWSLADEKWPNIIKDSAEFVEGIQLAGYAVPNIRNSIRLKPTYYLLQILGNTIKEGCKTIAGESVESGVYGTLVQNADGSQSLVVVNIGLTNVECTFDFVKSLGGATLYKYVFNQDVKASKYDDPLEVKDTLKSVTTKIEDNLEAYSVTVYTTAKQ